MEISFFGTLFQALGILGIAQAFLFTLAGAALMIRLIVKPGWRHGNWLTWGAMAGAGWLMVHCLTVVLWGGPQWLALTAISVIMTAFWTVATIFFAVLLWGGRELAKEIWRRVGGGIRQPRYR